MGNKKNKLKILVTGGSGFLGGKIVRLLLCLGYDVKSFSRKIDSDLSDLGVISICGNIKDAQAVKDAVKGCDVVFHTAAKVGLYGKYQDFYQTNVVGTQNVVKACLLFGVEKLIYTSSPSVIFDGRDHRGVEESKSYPDRFLAHYPATKAKAEQYILNSNSDKLAVVSLRPHLIWGPGDPHFLPKIIRLKQERKLRLIGNGENLVDTVFIDNAAKAHLIAMEKLSIGSSISGKAYFITNQEPWPVKKIVNQILAVADQPPVQKYIPFSVAYFIGFVLEKIHHIFNINKEPPLTRLTVLQLSKEHWYDTKNARQELGYYPEINLRDGFKLLKQSLFKTTRV